jgi:hypothetical protein
VSVTVERPKSNVDVEAVRDCCKASGISLRFDVDGVGNGLEILGISLGDLKSRGATKSVGIATEGTTLAAFMVCTGRLGVVVGLVK